MEPKVKRLKPHMASQFPAGPPMQASAMNAAQMSSFVAGQPITIHTASQGMYPYAHWANAATGSPLVQWANAATGTPVIQRARAASGPTVRHRPDAATAAGPPLIRRNTTVQSRVCQSVTNRSGTSNCLPPLSQTSSAAGLPLIKCTAAGSPVVQQATNCLAQKDTSAVPANRSALHVTLSTFGSSVQVATMSSDGSALTAASVSSDGSLMRATSIVSDGSSLHATAIISNGLSLHATAVSTDKSSLHATAISSDRSSLHTTAVRCEGSSLHATAIKAAGSTLSAAAVTSDGTFPSTAVVTSSELASCPKPINSGRRSPEAEVGDCEGPSSNSVSINPQGSPQQDSFTNCSKSSLHPGVTSSSTNN
ncbi:mucin-5AC-like isoform X1 [Schistocerca piceifrons]|uniref:mucin-5AC-like isoform X1 n=2 Tax=Schistocerca piceifrons TaxID=274613 RepID=UPI001F5EC16B|nr:mucin-5AC-like isoform X1 [Schistocerca piceifrons]